MPKEIAKQDIINDVHRVAELIQSDRVRMRDYEKYGIYSFGPVRNNFGSYNNTMLDYLFTLEPSDNTLDANAAKMLVKKFTKRMHKQGVTVTRETFHEYSGVTADVIDKTLGSFNSAIKHYGYGDNNAMVISPNNYHREDILDAFKHVCL